MDGIRLEIDGQDRSSEMSSLAVRMPRLVHTVPERGAWARKVLGPQGFEITVSGASESLAALADGGVKAHAVKVTVAGQSVTHPTQFHHTWMEGGVRKVFGCLAAETAVQWGNEPDSSPVPSKSDERE